MTLVLDASVLIGYLSPEDAHHDESVRLLSEAKPAFFVHTITLAEILVAPARINRQGEVADALADIGVEQAETFPLESQLLARARAEHGLRMPDACVLVLAEHLGYPLATFDLRLSNVAREAGVLQILPGDTKETVQWRLAAQGGTA